ncbi:MAG: hypothetical protein FWG38_06065 [Defluviitaleaceae bacterium]|nr:hypothetical protein [Defluviitaleaceae bacterium]
METMKMMKEDLRYFDIFPKVVQAGQTAAITVKCLEKRFVPATDTISIQVIPMLESPQGKREAEDMPPEVVGQVDGNLIRFTYAFGKEQEYRLKLNLSEKQTRTLSVFALDQDLYQRLPLKGDLHMHTTYSDGSESPETVPAYYRQEGFDFMVVSDHYNYQGSVAAKAFYQDANIALHIVNGEEVHPPTSFSAHIVNFGGSFSINDLFKNDEAGYFAEVDAIMDTLDRAAFENEKDLYVYASCLWVRDKIRAGGGLSIFAHPHWIVSTGYHVKDYLTTMLFQNKVFDAFELIGGQSQYENNMQLAFYMTALKNGYGDFPIVASSDSHWATQAKDNTINFSEAYTIVFATSNESAAIIDAVKQGLCVAVEHPHGQRPRVYGDYRLVSYAMFLLGEYFPLHDDMCREEGRLMLQLAHENGDMALVKADLASRRGQFDALVEKYLH